MYDTNDYKISPEEYPVDTKHLQEITCGEEEEEKLFVAIFEKVSDETLASLEQSTTDDDDEAWRQATHKLKSAASNIGARALWALCDHAEYNCPPAQAHKHEVLSEIQSEYKVVRTFFADRGTG